MVAFRESPQLPSMLKACSGTSDMKVSISWSTRRPAVVAIQRFAPSMVTQTASEKGRLPNRAIRTCLVTIRKLCHHGEGSAAYVCNEIVTCCIWMLAWIMLLFDHASLEWDCRQQFNTWFCVRCFVATTGYIVRRWSTKAVRRADAPSTVPVTISCHLSQYRLLKKYLTRFSHTSSPELHF